MDNQIKLSKVAYPRLDNSGIIVPLTNETMAYRKEKVLSLMAKENLDTLVIYSDVEHGSNFSYLTGFLTRFEESLLILHKSGKAYLILGNENMKMIAHTRIEAELLHCPLFSLPDQPMENDLPLEDILRKAELTNKSAIGIVGWKLFTSGKQNNRKLFDVPFYIVSAVNNVADKEKIENRTDLFSHAEYGVRTTNNANEIAHYEFGSSLASDCVLDAIRKTAVGEQEMEIAEGLVMYGQKPNVVPIAATGERFIHANLYPSNKRIQLGDKMSVTTGFKGGLASRSGYAVHEAGELPEAQGDYLEKVAKPYFNAVVTWLELIRPGMAGKELYRVMEEILPKSAYGWHLNPGHLTADEEWLSSPFKPYSDVALKSGMLLQIDIIPSVQGYAGAGCENGIALADEKLRSEVQHDYPELWDRIMARKNYIRDILQIDLQDSVLPLSSGVAFYNPFFLNKELAFTK